MFSRAPDRFAAALDVPGQGVSDAPDEELHPLVALAQSFVVAPVRAPEPFRSALRDTLAAAVESRAAAITPWSALADGLASWRVRRTGRLALSVAAGMLLLFALVTAAGRALPGDALYVAKRAFERAQGALPRNDDALAERHLAQAERRLSELRVLASRGRNDLLIGLLEDMDRDTLAAAGLAKSDTDRAALSAFATRQYSALSSLVLPSPADVRGRQSRALLAQLAGTTAESNLAPSADVPPTGSMPALTTDTPLELPTGTEPVSSGGPALDVRSSSLEAASSPAVPSPSMSRTGPVPASPGARPGAPAAGPVVTPARTAPGAVPSPVPTNATPVAATAGVPIASELPTFGSRSVPPVGTAQPPSFDPQPTVTAGPVPTVTTRPVPTGTTAPLPVIPPAPAPEVPVPVGTASLPPVIEVPAPSAGARTPGVSAVPVPLPSQALPLVPPAALPTTPVTSALPSLP